MAREIMITEADLQSLRGAYRPAARTGGGGDLAALDGLMPELRRARIIPWEDVPTDLVTINSRVELRDIHTGQLQTCRLVCGPEVDDVEQAVSVLSPMGVALLGRRVGDCIGWWADGAFQMAQIDRILYQAETAGRVDADALAPCA